VKGLVYLLIILLVGAVGGYLAGQKIDEWRGLRIPVPPAPRKAEDLTISITEMLNKEKAAYQSHDADQLLEDCASSYTEVNGNTGETMDLARARLFYHRYFRDGQAVNFTVENLQFSTAPHAVVAQADYKKVSNAWNEQNIRGYKGHGAWIFVRQNSAWRLASFAWTEESF
jgi:hypothetical protein